MLIAGHLFHSNLVFIKFSQKYLNSKVPVEALQRSKFLVSLVCATTGLDLADGVDYSSMVFDYFKISSVKKFLASVCLASEEVYSCFVLGFGLHFAYKLR